MVSASIAPLVRERLTEELPNFYHRAEIIREIPLPARFNLVHIVTGMRRCGKTFYLFQLMRRLMDDGIPRERMLYFDFSDDRLAPMEPGTMQAVVEEYWRQVPAAREGGLLPIPRRSAGMRRVARILPAHCRTRMRNTGDYRVVF